MLWSAYLNQVSSHYPMPPSNFMSTHSSEKITALMHRLCDAAAQETMSRFRSTLDITNKLEAGFDPVTEGDREAEKAIRAILNVEIPDDGIIGEEFGTTNADAEFQWIIDPIDGTRAFISGLPLWGTLIGLYRDGKPFAGVLDQPFTRERFLAVTDDGGKLHSTLAIDGQTAKPLRTKQTSNLSEATLMTTSPNIFSDEETPFYKHLENQTKLARYGCDCYAYGMVAAGQVDLVVESGLNIYDIAALIPIIEGAGGVVSDWSGGSAVNGGQILACANSAIQEQAIAHLNAQI